MFAVLGAYYVGAVAFSAIVLQPKQEDIGKELGVCNPGIGIAIVAVLSIVVLAPIAEELFFRGFFFAGLRSRWSLWPSALLSGAIFGLVHAPTGPTAAIPLAGLGVGLAWLYNKTGSLYPCDARPLPQQRDRDQRGDRMLSDGPAPAVSAHRLTKSYGERVAVAGIDFEVEPGICFGFLGPNGAGKTTTMKTIYGLATVDGGELQVLGMDANRERREIKSRIGVVPQETNLDGDLTVRENLLQQARYFGIDGEQAAERADELLEFSLLTDRAEERIHGLSGGMKRRLLISRALMGDPELVVLDEPTTGLDPQARLAVWNALDRLRRRGVTLLLTTHYMEEAERLCDRLVIMDGGRIVADGKPSAWCAARRPGGAGAAVRRGLRSGPAGRLARRPDPGP